MGWLSLMFMAGVVYNLFYGEISEALFGFFLAGVFFVAATMSPDSEHDDRSWCKKTYSTVIFVVVSTGVLIATYAALDAIEISPGTYIKTAKMRHEFQQLETGIHNYMKDEKLSLLEYVSIKDKYRQLSKAKAIDVLTE